LNIVGGDSKYDSKSVMTLFLQGIPCFFSNFYNYGGVAT